MLGLQWVDIDFENKTITISRQITPTLQGIIVTTPKTEDSARVITAPEKLLMLLKRHKKAQSASTKVVSLDDNVFVNITPDGQTMSPWILDKKFRKALKDNGLGHIRFHDLRHSCATLMLTVGVPLKVTSGLLGHKTVGITADLYTHILDEMKQDAAEKVNTAIFGESVES